MGMGGYRVISYSRRPVMVCLILLSCNLPADVLEYRLMVGGAAAKMIQLLADTLPENELGCGRETVFEYALKILQYLHSLELWKRNIPYTVWGVAIVLVSISIASGRPAWEAKAQFDTKEWGGRFLSAADGKQAHALATLILEELLGEE